MLPDKHIAASVTVGMIAALVDRDPKSLISSTVAGVAPDIDHAADYAIYYLMGKHKLILPFHAYELVAVLLLLAYRRRSHVLRAAGLAYLLHLLMDQAENQTKALGYSLVFRFLNRFDLQRISKAPDDAIRGREQDLERIRRILFGDASSS